MPRKHSLQRDGLDWQAFSASHFPGRPRHDLRALVAYGAYRRSPEPDARLSTALERGEDEGGVVQSGRGEPAEVP